MGESSLSERQEWTGYWWLPDAPKDRVPGVLRFDPRKGVKLDLIGGWEYRIMRQVDDGSTSLMSEFQSWPLIHGQVEDELPVTLLGVSLRSAGSFSLNRIFDLPTRMQLRAQTALVGVMLDDPDKSCFIAGIATIENLTQWSQHSGITMKSFVSAESKPLVGRIEIARLEALTAELGPVTARLHQLPWRPHAEQRRSGTVARVEERASVEFESDVPRSLTGWLDYLSAMADLISLSTLSACALTSIRAFLAPTPERYTEEHPLRNQRHEVAVYLRRVVRPRPEEGALEARQMILTLDDLSFDQLLPRWMGIHEKFAAARSMILGLRYVTGGYLETQVVTAVAAAESFHRALDSAPPIPEEEFIAMRKLLLEAVPKKFKSWLAGRVLRKELTLKHRLIGVIGRNVWIVPGVSPSPTPAAA